MALVSAQRNAEAVVSTTFYLRYVMSDVDPTSDLDLALMTSIAGTGSGAHLSPTLTGPVAPPSTATQAVEGNSVLPVRWLSNPLDAVTISGTVTLNLWGAESAMTINATFWVRLFRASNEGVDLATIDSAVRTGATELSVFPPATVHNWTRTPTSTVINQGERVGVIVYFDDSSGATMSSGGYGRLFFGWPGAEESWVQFTETITEYAPAAQTPFNQMQRLAPILAHQE
jgi:hypothetical protein